MLHLHIEGTSTGKKKTLRRNNLKAERIKCLENAKEKVVIPPSKDNERFI